MSFLRKWFQRKPSFDELMFSSLRTLKLQKMRLEHVASKLQSRDARLFSACTKAVEERDRERAETYANEIAQLRSIIGVVIQSELALEQIILRLETIKEIGHIMLELKPTLGLVHKLIDQLSGIMPEIATELDKVSDTIAETLIETTPQWPLITPEWSGVPSTRGLDGEKILEDAMKVAEKKLKEKLPTLPVLPAANEEAKSTTEPIAITVGFGEMSGDFSIASEWSVGEHTVNREHSCNEEFQKCFIPSTQSVQFSYWEEKVFKYAKEHNGEIDLVQCAFKLHISSQWVLKALEALSEKGKIVLEK